ncbi:hypothetical protein SUDANB43_06153 [Streptomyces sp. enrichment culture]
MVVITIGVGDLELPCQVDRERRRTVERVGSVLDKKAVTIRRFRDVEQLSAEAEESLPDVFRAKGGERALPRPQLAFK